MFIALEEEFICSLTVNVVLKLCVGSAITTLMGHCICPAISLHLPTNDCDKIFVQIEIHGRKTNKHGAFLLLQTTSTTETSELSIAIVQYEESYQDTGGHSENQQLHKAPGR